MLCPRDGAALGTIAVGVVTLARCPTCRGVWGTRAALETLASGPVVGRATELALGDDVGPTCPECRAAMQPQSAAGGVSVFACHACAKSWLDEDALATLRARKPPARRSEPPAAPTPVVPASEAAGQDVPLDPVFAPGPARELAILAPILAGAFAIAMAEIGEPFTFFLRLLFHELGHAVVAWSTGRSALPLPFGFTPWSLERSGLLVVMQWLFVVLLATWGVREERPRAVGVALGLGAILGVGLATPLDTSEPWVLFGGHAGEVLLPALALAAFHLPLPRRARWDFWRWPVATIAALALAAAIRDDLRIGAGTMPLPAGVFMGGDPAGGDLERLVSDHGWAREGLAATFGRLGVAALGIGVASHPIVLGARWARARARGA